MMSNEESHDHDKKDYEKDSKTPAKIVIFLLVVLFLPAFLLGLAMYYIGLRKMRQKLSVIVSVGLILSLISVLVWRVSDAWDKVVYVIQNIQQIGDIWTDLLPAYISADLIMGSIMGVFLVWWDIRQMKVNPYRLELEGSWMYKFKFRRTPYEIYKRKRTIEGLKNGKFHHPDKIPIGLNDDDEVVYRHNTEMTQSTIISGTVGSGKTITLMNCMYSDIKNGISFLVMDFKRSAEFATKLAYWCKEYNKNFYHFVNGTLESYQIPNSPGPAFYDPLKNGGSARPDMLLNMREYDTNSQVYKDSMRVILQTLFYCLSYIETHPQVERRARKISKNIIWDQGGIYKLNSIVNSTNGSAAGNLDELVAALENTEVEATIRDLHVNVKIKNTPASNSFQQLRGQMNTLMNSEYGRWLKDDSNGRNIDLFELLNNPDNVVLFSMNGESEKDFAKYMGSLILADLSAVSAKRRNNGIKNHVNVYIDEFQAVSPTSLAPLIEKSRESGFGITMSSQSFEQIIAASESNGDAYLNSLLDTCANFIIHAGSTDTSAERLSKITGKDDFTVYRQANQNKSALFALNWSNKRNQTVHTAKENRWINPPKTFMNLALPKASNGYKSTAVVIKKSDDTKGKKGSVREGTTVEKVWMIPDARVLEEYFTASENVLEPEHAIVPEVSVDDDNNGFDLPNQEDAVIETAEAPDSYLMSQNATEKDELDDFASLMSNDENFDKDEEEEADGGFVIEELDDEEDEDLSLSSNINITPQTISSSPRKSVQKSPTQSFNGFDSFKNFEKPKVRKERPKIKDKDDDEDDDSLPDLVF